ncbi:unnamed protein product [Spirodela intermedia]|uniref:Uncharacterized protein n=1 Tax=Spirodela intermedia TaxID=51605 RepID=A0A7I8KEY3_SPIIN|nr:unnamed protein product [Spirodela intermedia]
MGDPCLKQGEAGGQIVDKGPEIERSFVFWLFRGCFTVAFSLIVSCFLSFVFGILALLIGSSPGLQSPVSIPSQCRIVSSGVDLRSSKVCELSLSNCKAKYVLYPSGKPKIQCHDDYYWASVFKVEYKEYFSGRMIRGVAESPKEALPIYCRPSFNGVWRTKNKFKVNETYHCKYSLGTFKADIYPDHLFNCQVGDPSWAEMIRRFFTLFIKSFTWDTLQGWHHILAVATGSLGGIISSMLAVGIAKVLQPLWPALFKKLQPVKQHLSILSMQLRRPCLLIAYISAVSWLALQYIEIIGLKQVLIDSLSRMAITR